MLFVILCDFFYCIVLYCSVLYCFVLYCPVLLCSTLSPCINQFPVNNNDNDDYDNNNNNNRHHLTSIIRMCGFAPLLPYTLCDVALS